MKLIIFDIYGYIAHFRKYFSTTSSLSYAFPPRTSIIGMVAAIIGYERDEYYETFSSDNCRVALSLGTPVRKIVQKVNYLMTDKPLTVKKLRGMTPTPAQISTELVVADGPSFTQLKYRVFFNHVDSRLMELLESLLSRRRCIYPTALGTANSLAAVEYLCSCEADILYVKNMVALSTVIPISVVEEIRPQEGILIYYEENVPADFTRERLLKRKETYIYEGNGRPITVKLKDGTDVFKCRVMDDEVTGVFM